MKTNRFLSILVLPLCAVSATAIAQQPPAAPAVPQAKIEMGAMVYLASGQPQRGFVQDTNAQGVLYSLVERSPGQAVPWANVRGVIFEESDEIMREARAAFVQGQLDIAVDAMGAIADRYANMAWVPSSFSTEARYYQLEALRQLGRWQEMAPLMQTPTAQAIPTKLSAHYQPQFKLNLLWAQYGAGQGEGIKAAVTALEKPAVGSGKLLPSPSFKEMPLRELVQFTFFRARINEGAGNIDQALSDYYRTFSLSFGNEKLLGDMAMKAAMAIHAKNPAVVEAKPVPLRQIQSLAFLYKNAFGQGQIDPALSTYAVKPVLPKAAPAEDEEKKMPAPTEGSAPATPAGTPAAPAPGGDAAKGTPAAPAAGTPAVPAKGEPVKGAPAAPATPATPAKNAPAKK